MRDEAHIVLDEHILGVSVALGGEFQIFFLFGGGKRLRIASARKRAREKKQPP